MIAVLSGIFAMAIDSELIAANPVSDIGRSLCLPRGEMKKEFAPFTEAEALSFSLLVTVTLLETGVYRNGKKKGLVSH